MKDQPGFCLIYRSLDSIDRRSALGGCHLQKPDSPNVSQFGFAWRAEVASARRKGQRSRKGQEPMASNRAGRRRPDRLLVVRTLLRVGTSAGGKWHFNVTSFVQNSSPPSSVMQPSFLPILNGTRSRSSLHSTACQAPTSWMWRASS